MLGFLKIFRRKCCFCGQRSGDLKTVSSYGGNGNYDTIYHEKCLHLICDESRQYSNKMIEIAVDIVDRIRYWKVREEQRKERFRCSCEYLRENCIGKQNE